MRGMHGPKDEEKNCNRGFAGRGVVRYASDVLHGASVPRGARRNAPNTHVWLAENTGPYQPRYAVLVRSQASCDVSLLTPPIGMQNLMRN